MSIGGCFVDHFKSIFETSSPAIIEDMVNLFEPSITVEENFDLCSIPSEQEIYQALRSIRATKTPGPDGFTALFYKKY